MVKNPNIIKGSLLGQKAMMNCGLEAEVIEDNGSNDITVRFADGYTKKTKRQAFKNRQIDNPNRHSLIGKKLMMKCGMEAEVIEDKGAEKITIKFVDGTIITNRDRYSFLTQTMSPLEKVNLSSVNCYYNINMSFSADMRNILCTFVG